MPDPIIIAAIIATFMLAGTVKGVIGLGLPSISLGILTIVTDLPSAMVLLLVPSFVTNIWQALGGGNIRAILLRTWPFLLMATLAVLLGATALSRVDHHMLAVLLGTLLVAYAAVNLSGYRLSLTTEQELWAGPLFGTINGILSGMTGSSVVPGVMFLQAIGLSRDALIQAMGMLFAASNLALAVALKGNNLLTVELGAMSFAALIPTAIGMVFGRKIRQGLSEQRFQRLFFAGILLLGAYIIIHAALEMG